MHGSDTRRFTRLYPDEIPKFVGRNDVRTPTTDTAICPNWRMRRNDDEPTRLDYFERPVEYPIEVPMNSNAVRHRSSLADEVNRARSPDSRHADDNAKGGRRWRTGLAQTTPDPASGNHP